MVPASGAIGITVIEVLRLCVAELVAAGTRSLAAVLGTVEGGFARTRVAVSIPANLAIPVTGRWRFPIVANAVAAAGLAVSKTIEDRLAGLASAVPARPRASGAIRAPGTIQIGIANAVAATMAIGIAVQGGFLIGVAATVAAETQTDASRVVAIS